ncbi:MAG: DUF4910 domain-containing protein [Thermoanaerobaculia bacterium]|nr:DUF4910 domain-containing protein [Thermoanaerobaculia bacterium]
MARWTHRLEVLLLWALLATTPLLAQGFQPLLDEATLDLLHEELSGELAKDHVIAITRHSRIQGSRQYRDAANYVLERLREFGYSEEDAFIESYPSDGKIHYQTWQSPSGFDMTSAELRMVEPYDERIVGYPEVAMSLMTYSNPGHARGELVWVGAGTADADYEGKDVAGKIVLGTGYGGAVHRKAVLERGALAVVCFLDDERAEEYPDMLQYTGMWPRGSELDRVTFGFNLTRRQGRKLVDLIESGERVVVEGTAKGIGLEPYFMDLPVAFIRGSEKPEEVLIFSAHLDHPKESANDNASGSAAILDMARGLKKLIDEGRLPRPKRTLQFLWVPEFFGTMAYLDAHPEVRGPAYGGSYLANINMDMVGEDQELLHSRAIYTRTPNSIPSVLNDVVENMVQRVAGMEIRTPRGSLSTFNFAVTPYSGGSDHNMFIDRRVPGMMFGHDPDYTHHTSEDTPDKVDPVELEREEIIASGAMLYLANLTDPQATELALYAGGNAAGRLGRAASRAFGLVAGADRESLGAAGAEAQLVLDEELRVARQTLESIAWFSADGEAARRAGIAQLDGQHAVLTSALDGQLAERGLGERPLDLGFDLDPRVPVRTTRGPIDGSYLDEHLGSEDVAWLRSKDHPIRGTVQFELHNFMDGKLSVTELRNAVSAELTPVDHAAVKRYVEMLVGIGLAEWK